MHCTGPYRLQYALTNEMSVTQRGFHPTKTLVLPGVRFGGAISAGVAILFRVCAKANPPLGRDLSVSMLSSPRHAGSPWFRVFVRVGSGTGASQGCLGDCGSVLDQRVLQMRSRL